MDLPTPPLQRVPPQDVRRWRPAVPLRGAVPLPDLNVMFAQVVMHTNRILNHCCIRVLKTKSRRVAAAGLGGRQKLGLNVDYEYSPHSSECAPTHCEDHTLV